MSIDIMNAVWKTELGGPTIKAVAMKLADCSRDDGTNVYPSVKHIARRTEISERSAQYAVKQLVKLGVLRLVAAGGGVKTNTYAFDLPTLARLRAETQARWDAEDAKATGAKSAPVQNLRGAAGAPPGAAGAPYPSMNRQKKDQRSSNLSADDSKSRPAVLARFVSEAALDQVRKVAPHWDRQELLRRYLAWDGSKSASNPDRAFIGWVKKVTGGRPPPGMPTAPKLRVIAAAPEDDEAAA